MPRAVKRIEPGSRKPGRRPADQRPAAPGSFPLSHLPTGSLCLLALAVALGGCQPKPVTVYEPRLSMDNLVAGLVEPDNAYRLVVERYTQGRFPCSLAVARLALPVPELDSRLRVVAITPADEAYWTEAFRGFSAVRDLRFLSPRSLNPHGDGVGGLLISARRVGAPLLLVHTVNRHGPNSAQVLGVLYDVEARKPIAALHASAFHTDEAGEEVALEDELGDQRELDARYQASRAFEQRAAECLRDQIRRDRPAAKTEPHRWTPLYPYVWQPVPLPRPTASQPARPPQPPPAELQPPQPQPPRPQSGVSRPSPGPRPNTPLRVASPTPPATR